MNTHVQNKHEQEKKPVQQEPGEGFSIQLKMLFVGIVIGIIILILELTGVFKQLYN